MIKRLANIGPLRRLVLPVLSRINVGDITIRHHHTGRPFRLHSFRHRGYWWHGREREADVMAALKQFVSPGDVVFDVGAHIGYVSLLLSGAVGERGRVFAFEPGTNNLRYTRPNLSEAANVTLIEAAVGAEGGNALIFMEDLTGQNNSLVRDFDMLDRNEAAASLRAARSEVEVEVVALDDVARRHGVAPTFIKIDVEGFEAPVLRGAADLLARGRPVIMVEVHANPQNQREVWERLTESDYRCFRSGDGAVVNDLTELDGNVFAVPAEKSDEARRILRKGVDVR